MRHLIICPEYPPAPIPTGGIGTYVRNIARLLAEAGETVHVIGPLWQEASEPVEELLGGRLIVHRLPADRALDVPWNQGREALALDELNWLAWSALPAHSFSMQAALYAEKLVEDVGIDLIEAQEYDAPLYYFQLRRSLGLGPDRQPPCIVHLHSPSEMIFHYNDWNMARDDIRDARQMETFCIRNADLLLCPSRYLARQSEKHYNLDTDSINTIPLPVGNTPYLERNIDVWREGSICFVGRLEPRKGVVEWIDAAVTVANEYPALHFEFIGADLPYGEGRSVREHLESRIPDARMAQFAFRGNVSLDQLMDYLGKAKIAVVPSRWENFPNTCVEAMRTGLPVLASANGGMTEMIEDGSSGWIAKSQDPAGLEKALRTALQTPELELASMGRRAAERIGGICNNDETLARHLELRSDLVMRSRPAGLTQSSQPLHQTARELKNDSGGCFVVVAIVDDPFLVGECLDRIREQGIDPANGVIVVDEGRHQSHAAYLDEMRDAGWHIIAQASGGRAALWNTGLEFAVARNDKPGNILLIDERDRLLPGCIDGMRETLAKRDDVDLVSAWVRAVGRIRPRLSPAFPDQAVTNSIDTPVMLRANSAIADEGFDPTLSEDYELWGMTNGLLSSGGVAIVYPATLAERFVTKQAASNPEHRRMYRRLLEPIENIISANALTIVELLDGGHRSSAPKSADSASSAEYPPILRPSDIFRLTWKERYAVMKAVGREPRRAIGFLAWHTRNAVDRLRARKE
jgi:glycosyltransferase involved in cell wall biosynthesis